MSTDHNLGPINYVGGAAGHLTDTLSAEQNLGAINYIGGGAAGFTAQEA